MINVDGKKIIEYLTILGLSTKDKLTESDLKSSYRKLAKYYHPDNVDTGNAEKFKEILNAYEFCRDNLEYVNKQIEANFTLNFDNNGTSKEEMEFRATATLLILRLRILGLPIDELLTSKKLEDQYNAMRLLFSILSDNSRLKILQEAYLYCKSNIDIINLFISSHFNYSIFKAYKEKADEQRREKEEREKREREERQRKRAEEERIRKEKAEREKQIREQTERERIQREAELKAKKEKEAKAYYHNSIEEDIDKIVFSNYSENNQNIIRVIIDAYKKKETNIFNKTNADNEITGFKKDISKVKTIKQQLFVKKAFRRIGITFACFVVLFALVLTTISISKSVEKKRDYNNTISLIENGNYQEAKEQLKAYGDYEKSTNLINVCNGLQQINLSMQNGSQQDVISGINTITSNDVKVHITYKSNNGLIIKDLKDKYETTISSNINNLYAPINNLNNGYDFTGWETENVKYSDYNVYLTLLANWKVVSYSITYYLDGGVNNKSNPNIYSIEDNDITLLSPKKDNYTFVGWFDKKDGGNKVEKVVSGSYGNISLYARFTLNNYTVTFYNWDNSVLYTTTVSHGGNVEYPYDNPTKDKDVQYSYLFSKWDKSLKNITSDTIITAVYTSSLNQYTVIFKNYDGSEILKKQLDYGTIISYDGDLPIKPTTLDDRTAYEFIGWDKENYAITSDCVLTAVFKSINRYQASFYNGDTLLYTIMLDEGSTPTYVGDIPLKDRTQQYSFEFKDWEPAISEINEDVVYHSTFESILNKYTVTFKNYNGDLLATKVVEYGSSASYDGVTPTKARTQQYSYQFNGWDKSLSLITDDIAVTALYSEIINMYSVTFKNEDGSVLDVCTVDYGTDAFYSGSTPLKVKTQQYSYTFSGWNGTLDNIIDDKIVVAKYTSTLNKYTVTFKNYDGTLLGTSTVDYGTDASYSGVNPSKPDWCGCYYSFTGWNKVITNVTDDFEVIAEYSIQVADAEFELLSDGTGYSLIKYSGNAEHLYIPDSYNELPIVEIGKSAFDNCDNVRVVDIPDSIEYLRENCFTNAPIERLVFSNQSKLKSIEAYVIHSTMFTYHSYKYIDIFDHENELNVLQCNTVFPESTFFESKAIMPGGDYFGHYAIIYYENIDGHYEYAGGYAKEVYAFWVPNETWGLNFAQTYQVHNFEFYTETNCDEQNLIITSCQGCQVIHNVENCCDN